MGRSMIWLCSLDDFEAHFQRTLLVEIRALVACLKSEDGIKTECLQTKWDASFLEGKGKNSGAN